MNWRPTAIVCDRMMHHDRAARLATHRLWILETRSNKDHVSQVQHLDMLASKAGWNLGVFGWYQFGLLLSQRLQAEHQETARYAVVMPNVTAERRARLEL